VVIHNQSGHFPQDDESLDVPLVLVFIEFASVPRLLDGFVADFLLVVVAVRLGVDLDPDWLKVFGDLEVHPEAVPGSARLHPALLLYVLLVHKHRDLAHAVHQFIILRFGLAFFGHQFYQLCIRLFVELKLLLLVGVLHDRFFVRNAVPLFGFQCFRVSTDIDVVELSFIGPPIRLLLVFVHDILFLVNVQSVDSWFGIFVVLIQ